MDFWPFDLVTNLCRYDGVTWKKNFCTYKYMRWSNKECMKIVWQRALQNWEPIFILGVSNWVVLTEYWVLSIENWVLSTAVSSSWRSTDKLTAARPVAFINLALLLIVYYSPRTNVPDSAYNTPRLSNVEYQFVFWFNLFSAPGSGLLLTSSWLRVG